MTNPDPSYKAIFLGPKSENEYWARKEINSILDFWFKWRKSLFPSDSSPWLVTDEQTSHFKDQQKRISATLEHLNELLKAETPKYTPRYLGHMVSELSLPAILGHFATLLHNPNNTSKEVSKVGAVVEKEAIAMLAQMVGYAPDQSMGHFTSGGTVANFEAVWRARYRYDHWMSLGLYLAEECGERMDPFEIGHMGWEKYSNLLQQYSVPDDSLKQYSAVLGNPYSVYRLISKHIKTDYLGPVVLVPGNKHFSWQKAVNVFGLGEEAFWSIPLNRQGRIDLPEFKKLLDRAREAHRPVLLVVSVAGTTETGVVDSVDELQDFLDHLKAAQQLDFWHHVDAAYGGFMCSLMNKGFDLIAQSKLESCLNAMARSNSITLDPHKLGYVPYSCGAILTRDSVNYTVSSFLAPYLDRPDLGKGTWSSTLEGSRTAAGAAATWLTGKAVGYSSDVFASIIYSTFEACQTFKQSLKKSLPWVRVLEPTDTNILCFSIAETNDSLRASNLKTEKVFKLISESPLFSVSKTSLGMNSYEHQIKDHLSHHQGEADTDHLVLIRCVFMNPFWGEDSVQKNLIPEFLRELESGYRALNQNEDKNIF